MPPGVLPIGSQGFPALLNRLGVQPPPMSPFWWLSNTLQPISIVDQQGLIKNESRTLLFGGFPTAGSFVSAPASGAVIADTGPQPAGVYDLLLHWTGYSHTTAGGFLSLERRDASNTITLYFMPLTAIPLGLDTFFQGEKRFAIPIQASERLRIVNVLTLAAPAVVAATIFFERRPDS